MGSTAGRLLVETDYQLSLKGKLVENQCQLEFCKSYVTLSHVLPDPTPGTKNEVNAASLPRLPRSSFLEVEADFGAQRSRGYVMRPAERREEVVYGFLVGHVDGLQAQAPFVTVAAE